MPDTLLFLRASTAACSASAMFVLALIFARSRWKQIPAALIAVPGLIVGLLAGYALLEFFWRWPAINALDRFLMIVLPCALTIEMFGRVPGMSRTAIWLLRVLLAVLTARILLHGSVYLDPDRGEWSAGQAFGIPGLCGAGLLLEWILLHLLSYRRVAATVPLALAGCIQIAGIAIMLAGYLKGGTAALPLAAAISGVCIGAIVAERVFPGGSRAVHPTLISIGVLSLFSLLFIGRFFGALTTDRAILICLAPLCCWISELPVLRRFGRWSTGVIRLLAVGLTLLTVMIPAWRDFEQRLGSLLDR